MKKDYVECHAHSHNSLLDGASSPEVIVAQAASLGMKAIALTDHDALYGAIEFENAARAHGLKAIFGAEITLENDHHLTLLVENSTGWKNLCALISAGRMNAPKGQSRLPLETLPDHTEGLIVLSGCRRGEVTTALLNGHQDQALAAAKWYRDLFGPDHFWIEAQNHKLPNDKRLIAELAALAKQVQVGLVATNNVHYASRAERQLQDVLVCIKHNIALDASGHVRRPNSEYYLKSADEMALLFREHSKALADTLEIADRCNYSLEFGLQDLPIFPTSNGLDALSYLQALCLENLPRLYGEVASDVLARLDYELGVVGRSGLANYFLLVWDIIRFARDHDIRAQGRGSAANSLISFLLGISPIDPLKYNLTFERFLSDERRIMPDIDIDFCADSRERVIEYIYARYGTDHAAMACNIVTFQARSALRDVGKVLGFPPAVIDQLAKSLNARSPNGLELPALVEESQAGQQLIQLWSQIKGKPRHLGIHVGGFLISKSKLSERVPIEPATMEERVVAQFDKYAIEAAGLVKVDILGLRTLTVIDKALKFAEQLTGVRPDIDALSFDDPAVFDLISSARTIGVFQVESSAQASILPRMKPRCFEDIITTISLVRPGPILGQMKDPYLNRRTGVEPVTYLHPKLESTLKSTLGIILFQEDVLLVARDLAGFTPGQGELLRRALGSKKGPQELEALRGAFLDGAEAQGVSRQDAAAVFAKLEGFGHYSFSKAHAAAFACVVYQTAWLKVYHPTALFAALLDTQPVGFWSPDVLVGDAKRHGVTILPVDLNRSEGGCSVEKGAVRLGLDYVKGLGEASINRIEQARADREFTDLEDFCQRTQLPRKLVKNLILAGAMEQWGPRRDLLWALAQLRYQARELDLIFPDLDMQLVPMPAIEAFGYERAILGLNVHEHPMHFYRNWLQTNRILSSDDVLRCEHGAVVRTSGLVVVHQSPPTAHHVHFLLAEDELGFTSLVVFPQVYNNFHRVLRQGQILIAEGKVQRNDGVVNIIVEKAAPLCPL